MLCAFNIGFLHSARIHLFKSLLEFAFTNLPHLGTLEKATLMLGLPITKTCALNLFRVKNALKIRLRGF